MKIAAISLGDMADKWDRLTPEQEGIAWRVLRKLASYDGTFPADDRGARFVGWDVRGWRPRVKWLLSDRHLGFYEVGGMLRHTRLDNDLAAIVGQTEDAP